MFCTMCGNEVQDGAKFCGYCGRAVQVLEKRCAVCGTALKDGMKFCPECGRAVTVRQEQPEIQTRQEQPVVQAPQERPIVQTRQEQPVVQAKQEQQEVQAQQDTVNALFTAENSAGTFTEPTGSSDSGVQALAETWVHIKKLLAAKKSDIKPVAAIIAGVVLLAFAAIMVSGGISGKTAMERGSAVTMGLVSLESEDFTQHQDLPLYFSTYTVKQGDAMSGIAKKFGLLQNTVMLVNNIKSAKDIHEGQVLRIPNQDGVFYTTRKGDTLSVIAEKHKAEVSKIKAANELFSDAVNPDTTLFIPGATAPWEEVVVVNPSPAPASSAPVPAPVPRQRAVASGRILEWPVHGRLISFYGRRYSPFTGQREFHDGMDIAVPIGTPVKAAMEGRVESVGYDYAYGYFVIIRHTDGYKTLYSQLNSSNINRGAYVDTDTVIAFSGNTGASIEPHLHFTVYKDGSSIDPRTVLK